MKERRFGVSLVKHTVNVGGASSELGRVEKSE